MKKIIIASLYIYVGLFSKDINEKNYIDMKNDELNGSKEIVYNIKNTDDKNNTASWTTSDFAEHFKASTGKGVIGNTKMLFSMPGSNKAFLANPNQLTTESIKKDDTLKDLGQIKDGWGKSLESDIIANSLKNENGSISVTQSKIKCYITRDIPISYKCEKTGMVYGGGIDENGEIARRECENECFEQFSCVEVRKKTKNIITKAKDMNISSFGKNTSDIFSKSFVIKTNTSSKVEKITFDNNITIYKRAKISIDYKNKKLVGKKLVDNFYISGNDSQELYINDYVKEINVTLLLEAKDIRVDIKNFKIHYESTGGYICPHLQDISNEVAGNFAIKCPSGNIQTFNIGIKTYQICADYGIVGDNTDGTYSTKDGCNAICKEKKNCSLYLKTFSDKGLENFREGCIAGQTGCTDKLCKNLRLGNVKVVNESVFDAGQTPTKTIINSTQVPGVKRPRPLLREDLSFIKRSAEEWKDEAYKYMIDQQKFQISAYRFDEDTNDSSAYNLGYIDDGSGYTFGQVGDRTLYWIYKPKAFDIDQNMKMYAVLSTVIEKYKYDEHLNKIKTKDRILYIKTGTNDIFKPFARKVNAEYNVITTDFENQKGIKSIKNQAATWKYQSFDTSSRLWYSHSKNLQAEYFLNKKLTLDNNKPYIRMPIVNQVNNLLYNLKGVVRRVQKNGPKEMKIYSGKFDGTGEALGMYALYVFASKTGLTYENILSKIDSESIKPIFDSVSSSAYNKRVKNDNGNQKSNINLFLFGPASKKSAYIQIFPEKEEINKKGFLFIFAQ